MILHTWPLKRERPRNIEKENSTESTGWIWIMEMENEMGDGDSRDSLKDSIKLGLWRRERHEMRSPQSRNNHSAVR